MAEFRNEPPERVRTRLLQLYLNDHLAGATGGLALARRLAKNQRDTPFAADLAALAREVERDRETLIEIMDRIGVRRYPAKGWLALLAERAGRLKLNGSLVQRSPLSMVVELEMMRLGIEGKASGWRSLRELTEAEPRLDAAQLDELERHARAQADDVEGMRVRAVAMALLEG